MNLIKPKRLNKGDTIGIIALSGTIENKENLLRAKKYFEDKGYKIILSDNIFDKNRYLAGSDEKKVEELHKFFSSPDINAILCARGGFGAIRLIDKINFELIKNNPKIFAGYSDVSALETMILKNTGLITFHSPMAYGDFGVEEISELTEKSFFNTLTNENELIIAPDYGAKIYSHGEAQGTLWGGNLATITSLCGLDFVPDEKFIFFAEDLNEDTYKIDKMFTQLFNLEKFRKNIQGIILGEFSDINNQKHFDELFFELESNYKVPILSGFKITHSKDKITIPQGALASFNTKDCKLKIKNYLI